MIRPSSGVALRAAGKLTANDVPAEATRACDLPVLSGEIPLPNDIAALPHRSAIKPTTFQSFDTTTTAMTQTTTKLWHAGAARHRNFANATGGA
jgi:hypothetical protein